MYCALCQDLSRSSEYLHNERSGKGSSNVETDHKEDANRKYVKLDIYNKGYFQNIASYYKDSIEKKHSCLLTANARTCAAYRTSKYFRFDVTKKLCTRHGETFSWKSCFGRRLLG